MDINRTETARTKLINALGYGDTLDNPALMETAAVRIKRLEEALENVRREAELCINHGIKLMFVEYALQETTKILRQ